MTGVQTCALPISLPVLGGTAVEQRLLQHTGQPVAEVVVLARTFLLSLVTHTHTHTVCNNNVADQNILVLRTSPHHPPSSRWLAVRPPSPSHRARHGAGGVLMAPPVLSGGAGVHGLAGLNVTQCTACTKTHTHTEDRKSVV